MLGWFKFSLPRMLGQGSILRYVAKNRSKIPVFF
jgi:hypothetical protein